MQILNLADRPAHVDTVARWIWNEWREHSGLSEEQTRDRLLDPPDCPATLLAEDAGVPVGVLGFQRFERNPGEAPSLFIDALFVPEAHRGRGFGRALVHEGIERARAFAPDLYVYTSRQDWYRRHGWSLLRVDPVSGLFVLTRSTSPDAGS
jgi:predicted N-acetyltransferase YhbS